MRRNALASLSIAALVVAVPATAQVPAAPDTAWERGGTCYEVFVRSFQDSNGDGIGDLNGLIQKLDYINDGNPQSQRDLGANCIWLMPVAESPSYHGYDVSNYYRVEPDYGTNDDFKRLMAEAHRRGIRVLVDMVLNHSSSEHPAFQAALRDPSSPYRSWYRFSPTEPGPGPWGGPAWRKSPVRDEYFYGVFWEGMPDLNYQTPAVREEAKKVATFWLTEMGVDGFRLDAVPYLVEEGTVLSGSPGTHALLREYAAHVNRVKPGAYTVGEVWDSTAAMLQYYPDQLTSYFTFEVSDSLLAAVNRGSAKNLLAGYLRLQQALPPTRYSPFLRNHDQTRTMTVFGGDRAKARLAAVLLLTLPGIPFVYYGEEIGMSGDKPDERLRTPMQWTGAPGAGFTTAKPWEALQPDSATANVAAEERDPRSLLNLYRGLIHGRAANPALAAGRLIPVTASHDAVAAYLRRDGGRAVLVVANLGKTPVSGATLAAAAGALQPGRYLPTDLLTHASATPLTVGRAGAVSGYVPFGTLVPGEVHVLDLTRVGR
ncbi:alpha-amylase family glycosyl hydrolase [Longimicrobium sp.]|uniref:alpha-amylase family glycosyl hydrolase n=1 Tax=Longimicrobium sp. TaxID=2029185 RepID=UPI002CE888E6|nr:alpha-amylase family glycosyl hydrolase [Longimicrobium sp.]HSU14579.1 alpha-amylase family glycosyl hydrolase [Longimicrobium sp.]